VVLVAHASAHHVARSDLVLGSLGQDPRSPRDDVPDLVGVVVVQVERGRVTFRDAEEAERTRLRPVGLVGIVGAADHRHACPSMRA